MSLMVLGTIAIDNIKTPCGEKNSLLGGSASHFAMSARLFTKVHLAGIVGDDFPKEHLDLFKRKGIDISALIRVPGKTFAWKGEYKEENLNAAITLATELGVINKYKPKLSVAQKRIPNVFLANLDPDTQYNYIQEMKSAKFIGLDSMNLWINTCRASLLKVIKKADLFVANDGEANLLTGERNMIKAAKALSALGPKMIVVKKGEHGVIFYSKDFMFAYPAYPIDLVIDPTGAGDTFAGGLMGYLSKVNKINRASLQKAILYATTVASFNVQGFGVDKTSKLTLAQVNKRLNDLINYIKPY